MAPPVPPQPHARTYDVDPINAPGDGRTDFTFGDCAGGGAVRTLLVRPHHGPAWTAGLAVDRPGGRAAEGVFGTPSSRRACVVVRGSAFLVDVLAPTATFRVRTDGSVREVVELADEGLLLLATAWTITAVGAGAVAWTTDPLSVESLRLDHVVDHRLHGTADPDDEPRGFVIDLGTGVGNGG